MVQTVIGIEGWLAPVELRGESRWPGETPDRPRRSLVVPCVRQIQYHEASGSMTRCARGRSYSLGAQMHVGGLSFEVAAAVEVLPDKLTLLT